jgi:uncharacterized protein YjbI with pentapeptide repeats
MVRAVHNLEELAHRPFTLKLVAQYVPEIEADLLAGRKVYGVTLYRRMALRWLERDEGKHHIKAEHKLALAAHLAAHLWRARVSALPAEELENWFQDWRDGDPALKKRYAQVHTDQLEEDLRTATFLAREDSGGGSRFRFAHTSLQEFFLAQYLADSVRANTPDRWELPRPSDETLDFLGQLLAEADDPGLVLALGRWRHARRPAVNSLLLAYALRARRAGWPTPALRGIQLQGASLRNWVIDGRPADGTAGPRLLDLGEADFTGADCRDTVFASIRAEKAVFDRARLDRAEFHDCVCVGASWRGADCTATIWRGTQLSGANWEDATGYRPRFLLCADPPVGVPGFRRPVRAPALADPTSGIPRSAVAPVWLTGHTGGVRSCAWSPDGTRLATTSDDGTARIWDPSTGEQLQQLTGHTSGVTSCAWSPDGTRLATTSNDGTTGIYLLSSGDLGLVVGQVAPGRLGAGGFAAWRPGTNRVLAARGEAWRCLTWEGRDEQGAVVRLPLEHFGPIS